MMLHGPDSVLAQREFGIKQEPIDFDCIDWQEQVIPHGWSTVAFPDAEPIGRYMQSRKPAIGQTTVGEGKVISFGFQYGHSYSRRTMPIVPPVYGRREMHPIVLLNRTPVASLVGPSPLLPVAPIRGVEFVRFGKRLLLVNHRSVPLDFSRIPSRREWSQIQVAPGKLAAHSAVVLELLQAV